MRKVRMFLVTMLVGVSVFSTSIPVEAGCGNWYIKEVKKPECKPMSCGPGLGLPLYRQRQIWTRKCVSKSNKVTHPIKKNWKHLGCC